MYNHQYLGSYLSEMLVLLLLFTIIIRFKLSFEIFFHFVHKIVTNYMKYSSHSHNLGTNRTFRKITCVSLIGSSRFGDFLFLFFVCLISCMSNITGVEPSILQITRDSYNFEWINPRNINMTDHLLTLELKYELT